MISIEKIFCIIILIIAIISFIYTIAIAVSFKFNQKQKNKYNECLELVRQSTREMKDALTEKDIKKIDKTINLDKLMMNLYDKYLKLLDKLNSNNKDFNNILTGYIKEVYNNKIDIYKEKGYKEITDEIELINYSIIEFNKTKLKFRVAITCFNYKELNSEVISGSKYERVEQIFILTYIKEKKQWLISNIEKVYEKELSI